ncbi:MAG TPA: thioesterase family protein [Solirubrobacteraceae bacterium]|nr:thioesterase family protein [Solirubrobacteraceae bacterium]
MSEAPLTRSWRARYGECDQQGVVFNAHYLAWFDDDMTELWRAAFGSYQAAVERGIEIVVAESHLRYRASVRFDELVQIEVAVTHMGNTSLTTHHSVTRDGAVLVEGTLRHVIVDPQTLSKKPMPDWFRAGLAQFAGDAYLGSGSLPGQ